VEIGEENGVGSRREGMDLEVDVDLPYSNFSKG
jgi:hypothetical protein